MEPGRQLGSGRREPLIPLLSSGSMGMGLIYEVSFTGENKFKEATHVVVLPFCVQTLDLRIKRVLVGDIQNTVAPFVSPHLFIVKLGVSILHCLKEPLLVDERENGDTLPSHFLAVHINFEILGIEIDDRRFFVRHERMEDLRNVNATM